MRLKEIIMLVLVMIAFIAVTSIGVYYEDEAFKEASSINIKQKDNK